MHLTFFYIYLVLSKTLYIFMKILNKMTHIEDLMRLKQARIDALQRELAKLQDEVEKLKADGEINNQILTEIYYENR